ncbi:MAG TPA: S4 domain-containing protein [Candidatus Krumholzibacteria bacterium]|nr:S4 domain-containing protein [Candidatus Krumholzibacteria bacterium]HPD70852.1 S4 domain-containing protein [Candidatus Krumholzibacteria bacterium]HRY39448.1 S4 domain-containing protein [Candidatus Krumholzibacteria bacterium]
MSDRRRPAANPRLAEYRRPDGAWCPPRPEGLARILAKAGFGARPRTEALVRAGRLTVNGLVVRDPALAVEPGDEIRLDGEVLREAQRRYLILFKPPGTECQASRGCRSVFDYLPASAVGLEPAGRLDARARGLLLFSNDQWWNTRVAENPDLERRYEVVVTGPMSPMELDVLRGGMNLPSQGPFKPLRVDVVAAANDRTSLLLVLRGGHHRQIRPVLTALRHEVLWVARTGIGPVTLHGLAPGQWRDLTALEIHRLARIPADGAA